jgi:hypothetical protein
MTSIDPVTRPIPDELRRYLQGSLDSGATIIRVHRNDVQLLLGHMEDEEGGAHDLR